MLLHAVDIKKIMAMIRDIMEENKEYLCELDGAIGDGDIGLTVSKGFRAIAEDVLEQDVTDIGLLLKKCGFTLAEAVPSTIGTILAGSLMQAGNNLKGQEALDTTGLASLLGGMIEGIQKRGKASIGDKTILDSLHPAWQSLKEDGEKGVDLRISLAKAYRAAQNGAEQTKQMQSVHGRAQRYNENSIGHQDPGATVGALIVKGFYLYVS